MGGPGRAATQFRVAVLTSLVCSGATAVYAAAGATPAPIILLILSIAPLITISLWIERDAAGSEVGTVHDLGFFFYLAWFIVIPWYVWRTRGRACWWLIVLLFLLVAAPFITAAAVSA